MTDPAADLPPEEPFEGEDVPDSVLVAQSEEDGLADRARHSGVGVEDPNIVGDVGPTDIPPGTDPESAGSDVPWVEDEPT
jgi:hypothetical protein